MGSLTDYFEARAYRPRFHLGDRVFGHYKKIPFIGSVGVERVVSSQRGPEVAVMLDLPLHYQGQFLKIVTVKPRDIKPLVRFDEEEKAVPKRKKKSVV